MTEPLNIAELEMDQLIEPMGENDEFVETSPAPPAFPLEVLPPAVAEFVNAVAEVTSSPVDLPAALSLAVAATATGRSRAVRIHRSWREEPRLWMAIVSAPGSSKTPVFQAVASPILEIEGELAEQNAAARAQYEIDRQKAQAELELWKKQTKGNEAVTEDPPANPDPPAYCRIRVDDITTEALATRLADNPRGLGVLVDELSTWALSFNRYRAGGDRQFWISLASGSSLSVDRRGQPDPLYVREPFAIVAGTIQPDALRDLVASDGRHDGFLERLLMISPLARPIRYVEQGIPESLERTWAGIVRRLVGLNMADDSPVELDFSREARTAWRTLSEAHLSRLNDDSEDSIPEFLRAFWRKAHAVAARIALLLQLLHDVADDRDSRQIETHHVEAGFQFARYATEHWARCVRRLRGNTGEASAEVEKIRGALAAAGGTRVAQAEIHRQLANHMSAEQLRTGLTVLESLGEVVGDQEETGGRPRRIWSLASNV